MAKHTECGHQNSLVSLILESIRVGLQKSNTMKHTFTLSSSAFQQSLYPNHMMTLAFLVPFSPHLIYFKSSTSLTTAIYQRAGSRVECVCVCVCVCASTTLAVLCGVTDL